jgi:hypothetical protein
VGSTKTTLYWSSTSCKYGVTRNDSRVDHYQVTDLEDRESTLPYLQPFVLLLYSNFGQLCLL